jgi:hypothetical protein
MCEIQMPTREYEQEWLVVEFLLLIYIYDYLNNEVLLDHLILDLKQIMLEAQVEHWLMLIHIFQ